MQEIDLTEERGHRRGVASCLRAPDPPGALRANWTSGQVMSGGKTMEDERKEELNVGGS